MKSPLVEALRQAQGSGDAGEAGAPEAAVDESLAGRDGGEVLQETDPGDHPNSLDFLAIEDTPDVLTADTGVDPAESLDLQVANDDESRDEAGSSMMETGVLPAAAATPPSKAPRLALFAPLICVAAALASGALHFSYRWIAGGHENADLAVMSGKEADGTGVPANDSLLAPPTRFKLDVDPPAAHLDDSRADRRRAGSPGRGTASP